MLDFFRIWTRPTKNGIDIYPKFVIRKSQDLMIQGGTFYAVWDEGAQLWSTNEDTAIRLIDDALDAFAEEYKKTTSEKVSVLHLWDADTRMIDRWHHFCESQMSDNFHSLDEKLIFSNTPSKKTDYASKRLPYPLEEGSIEAYDELMNVLYSPGERHKLEWAIGAIVSGDSVNIQKFIVMYGSAGTGKSTVMNIIQDLFAGYYSAFDAKALGSLSAAFALEPFKTNPLVAIQHDGDLSRIEDNTRLNSVVSHELMTVNEKFKSAYASRFNAFLFMGTNKPVKITDSKSGLLRRLIDVSPTGEKIPPTRYKLLVNKIKFELGAIASHCLKVYKEDPDAFDNYVPISMMGASNDFYNFMLEQYENYSAFNYTTLKTSWAAYKEYCEDAKVPYPYSQRLFKEELKNYFARFEERGLTADGTRVRNYYEGFLSQKFEYEPLQTYAPEGRSYTLIFEEGIESAFDRMAADWPAQKASQQETPSCKWENVRTTLKDLDTSELHYVRTPLNHIVIDFDIPDENGNKCFEKNLEAASKWPSTYAELSKSGKGIHLHYLYSGDPTELSRIYADYIEIKVFSGKASLRRKLTKCNRLDISTINSGGLPLKGGGTKVVTKDTIKSERTLRRMIQRNLEKEFHPGTKPSIDFIHKILEDVYEAGLHYDITDMRPAVLAFATGSSHQAPYCIALVNEMKFKSDDPTTNVNSEDNRLVFYDVEVFPNLFLVNYKFQDDDKVVRLINPSPAEIEALMQYRLVGFNCRRYDNHILYARMMGYSNEQLYNLSQRIINNSPNCFFGEAYNISYTDVYDFSAKKQSLKKFEIELEITHKELGLPWDKPVPEELWEKVAEYCDNDVIATEAVFNARHADFEARKALIRAIESLHPEVSACENDTTNSLSAKLIFGNNRKPQSEFIYTDLSKEFPGYKFENGVSTYRGYALGEGGFVWARHGMYGRAKTYDVVSMHPHSLKALNLLGEYYTKMFYDLVKARVAIKHKDFEALDILLNGAFAEYKNADPKELKNLAAALKIVINSVYGLTAASFMNPFRDPRNIDNIVAKRGALFMATLKDEIEKRFGQVVIHIKTDSIKLLDPTPEMEQFVYDFGRQYGYEFEVEHVFEKICLVNDAVYIAKLAEDDPEEPGKWTATGTQFQVPYVFKTLFSKEKITFDDLCETKSASSELYLDFNESLPNVEDFEMLQEVRDKISRGKKIAKKWERFAEEHANISDEALQRLVDEGHHYQFVGKVGRFCPVVEGSGGGDLLRKKDDKFYAVGGTKGYRWKEAEVVFGLGEEDTIDRSYYNNLVDEAVATINEFGDFEMFVSDSPFIYI